MTVSFEIPREIEQTLQADDVDVNGDAKEAYLVELYRQHRISQHQLAEALGLTRVEADGLLKQHQVWLELTIEELAAQTASLREQRRK
jgi:hypothetical protein